jgi:glutamate-1-semialdehyde aminotransferase
MGARLRDAFNELARKHNVACIATGFGAAFAIHFTSRTTLTDYRDTLDDDPAQLRRFLVALLEEGVLSVPDGRFYTSAAHQPADIDQTIAAVDRAFARLQA